MNGGRLIWYTFPFVTCVVLAISIGLIKELFERGHLRKSRLLRKLIYILVMLLVIFATGLLYAFFFGE